MNELQQRIDTDGIGGLLISLDGIDGSGKSTQIENLSSYLQSLGHDVLVTRDPGSTDLGKTLRGILLDSDLTMHPRSEAMLFMASRCEMIEQILRPAIAAGKTIISDRFLLANVVYQSVAGGVAPSKLWQMGGLANGDFAPDLTLLLDMSAEDAFERLGDHKDRMESRGVEYMESVRKQFLVQLDHCPGTTAIIDAKDAPEAVSKRIRDVVTQFLSDRKTSAS